MTESEEAPVEQTGPVDREQHIAILENILVEVKELREHFRAVTCSLEDLASEIQSMLDDQIKEP